MTKDLIVQSQTGDSSATFSLVKKFEPILKKYAYKLYYEDAYNDLLVDFIELVHNIRLDRMNNASEMGVISYISTSIRNSYVKRLSSLKKHQHFVPYSSLNENELYYIEALTSTSDTYFKLELKDIEHVLTAVELSVIKMIYILDFTVTETAFLHRISRQAVNKTKKRALKKLEHWFQASAGSGIA